MPDNSQTASQENGATWYNPLTWFGEGSKPKEKGALDDAADVVEKANSAAKGCAPAEADTAEMYAEMGGYKPLIAPAAPSKDCGKSR